MALYVGENQLNGALAVGVDAAAGDTTPDQFTFADLLDQVAGSGPYRGQEPITGLDVGAILSVTNGRLSNDGGATWGASTTYVVGQTLVESDEVVASNTHGATLSSPPTQVNGVSDTFSVTTAANYSVNLIDSLQFNDTIQVSAAGQLSQSLSDTLSFTENLSVSANGQATIQLSDSLVFTEAVEVSSAVVVSDLTLTDTLIFTESIFVRGQADTRQVHQLQGVL